MKTISLFLILTALNSLNLSAQQWQWAKDLGSGMGVDIKTDQSGNIYLLAGTGSVYANTTLTCGQGNVIAKHDSLGNLIWARGFNFDIGQFNLDRQGNIYVSGSFQLWFPNSPNYFCGGNNPNITVSSQGGADMYLCKYTNNGDLLWVSTWAGFSNSDDKPTAAKTDENGNTIIAGQSFFKAHLYAEADLDHFLLKYDSQGNLLWSKSNNFHGGMVTNGLDIDNQGNFYSAGYFQDSAYFDNIAFKSNGFHTVFIAKYNSAGNIIWAKKDGTGYDHCKDLCLDKKGNFYITGTASSQSLFSGTAITQSGMFVAKYDTTGNGLWLRGAAGTRGISVGADSAANCFITGDFIGTTLTFTTNNNPITFTNQRSGEIFVVKYDKNGNAKWAAASVGNNGYTNNGLGITTNNSSCFITGIYSGTTSFGSTTLSGGSLFIAKIKDSLSGIITDTKKNLEVPAQIFKIYPNPVRNFVSLSYTSEEEIKTMEIIISNITGQIMYKENATINNKEFNTTIDLHAYNKGLYFIEARPVYSTENTGRKYLKKVIIQ